MMSYATKEHMTIDNAVSNAKRIRVFISVANSPASLIFDITKKSLRNGMDSGLDILNDDDVATWHYDLERYILDIHFAC